MIKHGRGQLIPSHFFNILNAHACFRGELYSYSLFPLILRLLQRISSGEKGKEKQTILRGVGKNINLLVTYTPRIKLILGTGITGSINGFSKSRPTHKKRGPWMYHVA